MVQYKIVGKNITFLCPQAELKAQTDVCRVGLRGTFTSWQSDWRFMLKANDKGDWSLTLPLSQVRIPGNSGLPEFILYTEDTWGNKTFLKADSREGFHFLGNTVIMLDDSLSPQQIAQNEKLALTVRPLSEYNLNNDADCHTLANMRLVPGTQNLWRGYHPYKKSRPELDSEDARIATVNRLLEVHGIKSVITLSGDESCDPSLRESISPYMQKIRKQWNQMITNTSYETVYFRSDSMEFAKLIASVVQFINIHPAPYYVHCRLGSDRTGTVSAVLAALCGASWAEIAADYQKTCKMAIQEFRDSRLLAYSFNTLLRGKDYGNDLKKALCSHLVEQEVLSEQEIEKAVCRLKNF